MGGSAETAETGNTKTSLQETILTSIREETYLNRCSYKTSLTWQRDMSWCLSYIEPPEKAVR